ncbi:MAG: Ig-like domain-containing protein, partial [Clostridia bacterium]
GDDRQNHNTPVQVVGPEGLGNFTGGVAVAAGFRHSAAVREDGTIWTWGDNEHGQLGNQKARKGTEAYVPVQVKKAVLTTLGLSDGYETPAFSPMVTSYTAELSGVSSITLTPAANDATATITASVNGSPAVTIASGTTSVPFPLKAGINQVDITVTADDGITTQVYQLKIQRGNQLPVTSSQEYSIAKDSPVNGTVLATDGDGDPLTYIIVADATHGTAVLTNDRTGAFTYTPEPGYTGTDSFSFQVNDGYGDSNIGLVRITMVDSKPPVLQNPIAAQTVYVGETKVIDLTSTFSDPENDLLILSSKANDDSKAKLLMKDSKLSIQGVAEGEIDVTVRATDPFGGFIETSFTLTVAEIPNQPPVAQAGSFTTTMNKVVHGKLGATDAENNPLVFSIVENGVKGKAELLDPAQGTFVYTPNRGATGTDLFTFRVSDGKTVSNTAVVNVTINASVPQPPQYYPVNGVELDKEQLTLTAGTTPVQLQAKINPDYATNQQVMWESTAPDVAIVDQNGRVSPLKRGTAIIRVTTVDGNKTAECVVTVRAEANNVTSVELDRHELVLQRGGKTVQLKATVTPEDASNQKLYWKSSNRKVARVNANGVVTSVSPGEATITVTTEDGGKTDSCLVTVVSGDIVGLEVSEKNMLLKPRKSAKLQVFSVDKRGKKKNITLDKQTKIVSSDSKVVTVKGDTIKAGSKVGEATLTITYQGLKTVVKVFVSKVSVKELVPSEKSVTLEAGKSSEVTIQARMSDGSQKEVTELVTWNSSNPDIVTVEAGVLTTKKAGSAKVTATYGGKMITITVKATKRKP